MKKEKLLPSVEEKSFSQEAVVYRNMNRRFVDEIFAKVHEKVLLPNGRYRYVRSREERENLDIRARNKWRVIIEQSNML